MTSPRLPGQRTRRRVSRCWYSTVLSLPLAALAAQPVPASTPFSEDLDTLQLATELYDDGLYEEAGQLIARLDRDGLPQEGRPLFDRYHPLIEKAVGQVQTARSDLLDVEVALRRQAYDTARQKIAAVLANDCAPPALKQDARQHLSMVQFRQRQRVLAAELEDPGDDRAARLALGRQRQARAAKALAARDYQQAQDQYSLASWYFPEAELRTVYIDPRDGAVFPRLPPARLHGVEVLVPVRNVTMNLQLGTGRLVGIESFRFSDAPVSGVGAGGFVQLPSVQRVQIKTTVTAPAVEVPPPTVTRVEVTDRYIVIVRPDL